MIVAVE